MFANMIKPTDGQQDAMYRTLIMEHIRMDIDQAYRDAVRKHPDNEWPRDVIHMVAIMAEEAGEAVQAANNVVHDGASLELLRNELAQTAAMCIRCLIHLRDTAQP